MIKEYIGINATESSISSDIVNKITVEIKYDAWPAILFGVLLAIVAIILLIMLLKYYSYLDTKIKKEYEYKKSKLEKDDNFRRNYLCKSCEKCSKDQE